MIPFLPLDLWLYRIFFVGLRKVSDIFVSNNPFDGFSVFWWTKFLKKKSGIKTHTLYDVETQIPAFFHITETSVHDSKAMNELPYETGSYYILDRAYNNFKILYETSAKPYPILYHSCF